MSTPAPTQPAEQITTPPASGNGGTTPEQQPAESTLTLTQAALDALIKDRLDRQQRAISAATAKEKADAEAAKLAEQGEFKQLAETAASERDALKAQLAARDHADLQRTVAAEHHLPAEAASRLQGANRAELETDAKNLAKLLATPPPPPTPGNRPGPRPQSGADPGATTEAQLRQSPRYSAI